MHRLFFKNAIRIIFPFFVFFALTHVCGNKRENEEQRRVENQEPQHGDENRIVKHEHLLDGNNVREGTVRPERIELPSSGSKRDTLSIKLRARVI